MDINSIYKAASIFSKYAYDYEDDPSYQAAKNTVQDPNIAIELYNKNPKAYEALVNHRNENDEVKFKLTTSNNGIWSVVAYPVLRQDANGNVTRIELPREVLIAVNNLITSKIPKPPADMSANIEFSWIVGFD